MDVLERIEQLRDERNWSNYKLSQVSGVSQTTIRNMFARNTLPGIATLEAICMGFGMTLSQFFADGEEFVPLTDEQRDMLKTWGTLTEGQKTAFMQLMKKL
jgi:transcriptional regulator with XRE-family HTH domain